MRIVGAGVVIGAAINAAAFGEADASPPQARSAGGEPAVTPPSPDPNDPFNDPSLLATFENGQAQGVVLTEDTPVVRATSDASFLEGRFWTTPGTIQSTSQAIADLQLPAYNSAQVQVQGVIPAGTEVLVGRVAGGNAVQIVVAHGQQVRIVGWTPLGP